MDIDAAWDVIERVLRDRLPAVYGTLRAPVSEDELAGLAATAGHPLPQDFVTSLRRHDGQDNPTRLLDLYDHYTLLSAEAMIEQSDMRVSALGGDHGGPFETYEWMTPDKVRPIMNTRRWLQFTDAEGEGHALDLDPLPTGELGQIIHLPVDGPTPTPHFASYTAWLSSYAARLDAGAFVIDETGGLWLED